MINFYSYNGYWRFIDNLIANAHDEQDLREAVAHQKILSPTTIKTYTTQHPCHTPDTALYLDVLKQYNLLKEK